jgi:uncharacterized caspase-like protein
MTVPANAITSSAHALHTWILRITADIVTFLKSFLEEIYTRKGAMAAFAQIFRRSAWYIALVILLLAVQAANAAQKRVALVIGNSNYDHVSTLSNPVNDTEDLGAALARIGFDVTIGRNLDYRGMRIALRDFAEAAQTADVVLIYFAGHGVEIENVNYLIPINAQLRSDRDVEFETIRLDAVIRAIAGAPALKLVLVDACRNNPFLSTMQRTGSTRSLGRGLGRIDPGGVLVGYAARGGTLALDGDGRNSPYAHALLQHIEEPGLEIGKLFRKVRDTVYRLTDGYQEPFTYGSLPGEDIFLVPTVATPQPKPSDSSRAEPAPESEAQQAAKAEKLLKAALKLEDETSKTSVLTMVSLLYPNTTSGRSAKYMAEQLQRKNEQVEPRSNETLLVRPGTYTNAPIKPSNSSVEAWLKLGPKDFRVLQRALNTLGFNAGTEDGIFGPRSRAALKNFQSRMGQMRTGYLTAETVAALSAIDTSRNPQAAQTTPVAQPAPSRSQEQPTGFDGVYVIEIRRRPDPNYRGLPAGEATKVMLRLEYRKSGGSFTLTNARNYSRSSSNPPKIQIASLSDSGALSIRGKMNYLKNKVRMTNFSIRRQLPNGFDRGASTVSEHGRFDDAYFVNVKVTRR